MGIFSSIFSTGSKVALAREWAKERARRDLGPLAAEFIPLVDQLPATQVMGLPEYSVITIVESFADLTKRRVPPGEILARIEAHRAPTMGSVRLPGRAELEVYVFDRISLEHPSAQVDREWTDLLVSRCRQRFGLPPRPDLSWMDAPMITRSQKPSAPPVAASPPAIDWEGKYTALRWAVYEHYWLGVSTEEQFCAAIEPFMDELPPP